MALSEYQNSLIAYDTTTSEIVDFVAKTRGVPLVSELTNYNPAIHSLTGVMNTYDADDFDSLGNLTPTAREKYNIDSAISPLIAKDVPALPVNNFDYVQVNVQGQLSAFTEGPVPINYDSTLVYTLKDLLGADLSNDIATGLPLVPADGTTIIVVSLQKYDHTNVAMGSYGEWFYITATGGTQSVRRIQLSAGGAATFTWTASTEEKEVAITILPFQLPEGPQVYEYPTSGTAFTLYCGDDDEALPGV
jgi:hypothetical protein